MDGDIIDHYILGVFEVRDGKITIDFRASVDEYGNIVSCNSGILNKVIVYVPTVEGLYQILVQSDTYSGVGEFYIF